MQKIVLRVTDQRVIVLFGSCDRRIGFMVATRTYRRIAARNPTRM
jgi:hypothetical protein